MTPVTGEVIDRQTAIKTGREHYFTGKPCKAGHVDKRFTNSRQCLACNRAKTAKHRERHPDRVRQVNRQQYAKKRELRKAVQREWNVKNAARAARYASEYRTANPEVKREWARANKRKVVLYASTRRAAKQRRTPVWADLAAIEQFYLGCPEGYEVDHIIPLRGVVVSGLHVRENLQYLPRSENARKRNKFNPADHTT